MSVIIAGLDARRQIQSQLIDQAWPKHDYEFVKINDQEMGPDLIVALRSIMDIADDAARNGHSQFKLHFYDDKYAISHIVLMVTYLESSHYGVKYLNEIVGTLEYPIYTLHNNLWVKENPDALHIGRTLVIKSC